MSEGDFSEVAAYVACGDVLAVSKAVRTLCEPDGIESEFSITHWIITAIASLLFFGLTGVAQAGNTLPNVPILVSVPTSTQTKPVGTLRNIGAYPAEIAGATITPLPGGEVLVFGFDPIGYGLRDEGGKPAVTLRNRWKRGYDYGFRVNSAWDSLVWKPERKGWTKIPLPPDCAGARYLHTATVLPDGKVLIAGGLCDVQVFGNTGGPSAGYTKLWLWNSTAETWEQAPSLNDPRIFHSATLMQDGSVLFVGGESDPTLSAAGEPVLDSVESYNGKSVTRLPSMHEARAKHTATLLGNGTVLVVGGMDREGKAIGSVELWDPLLRAWSVLPSLHTPRYAHTATLLDDGRVMVAGGIGPDGHALDSVEFWDPATTRWTIGSPLPRPARHPAAVKLPDGNVLLAGGTSQFTPDPIDWALSWDKFTDTWSPAGVAKPDDQNDLVYPPTLLPSDDGSALIFSTRHIFRWRPLADAQPSGQPAWRSVTSMVALRDGNLMVIGETDLNTWTANIWHPRDNTWTFAGGLAYQSRNYTRAVLLPSGQVMHVGLGGNNDILCELSDIEHQHWTDCGHFSLTHASDSPIGLELLSNGRVALVANAADAFLYDQNANRWDVADLEWNNQDMAYGAPIRPMHPLARLWDKVHGTWLNASGAAAEFWNGAFGHLGYEVVLGAGHVNKVPSRGAPPSLLWDPRQQQWTYAFPPGNTKMGSKVQLLPDGCALSWSPLHLFHPDTGDVTGLNDPGIGIQPAEGSMLVLADGTAVFAGIPDGGVGTGFFHRKVSCAGFALAQEDQLLMPGVFSQSPNAPHQSAASPAPPARPLPPRSRVSLLRDYLKANPWPLRAVLGVLLLYVLLRYLVLPLVRHTARRSIPRRHMATLTRELPRPYAWGVRIVIYGLLALVFVPALKGFVHFHHERTAEDCKHDASACLDPHTGILQSIPALQNASPDHSQPEIPCRFVGIWTSREGALAFRVTLKDDGTYSVQANAAGIGDPGGYTGYWMVQANKMVWRDHARPELGPDINPILSESEGRFMLMEQDGRHTQFELIKRAASDRCKKQDG